MLNRWKPFIIASTILLLLFIGFTYLLDEAKSEKKAANLLSINGNSELKLGNTYFILNSMEEHKNKYIYLTLSPDDTYEIRFYDKKERVNSLVINSGVWAQTIDSNGSKPIANLVPAYISNKGYYRVSITPIGGDGSYSVSGFKLLDTIDPELKESINLIDFEIKQLKISISDAAYKKIEAKRREALNLGILQSDDSDNVDAELSVDGEKYNAELRLKGDWTDHLEGSKWSFRIDIKGDHCAYGMQKFSLQPQETRRGIWEYLIYEMYREQGGVALRYDFVDVYVNGVYKGVYALEEFMEKRVIENSQKREGPIIKTNEELLWEKWAVYDGENNKIVPISQALQVFSEKKTLDSPLLTGYAAYAISQMNKFERGEASAEEVFDINLYSKLLAIRDLFAAGHGSAWHNMRHYYNPITGLLEPIPFDELAFSADVFGFDVDVLDSPIMNGLFKDDRQNELYFYYLQRFADEYPYFIERHIEQINRAEIIIQRDDPVYRFDPWEVDDRIEKIKLAVNPEAVYYDTSNFSAGEFSVLIINKNPVAIYVQALKQNGKIIAEYPNLKIAAGQSAEFEVPKIERENGKALSVEYCILVSNKGFSSKKINSMQMDH